MNIRSIAAVFAVLFIAGISLLVFGGNHSVAANSAPVKVEAVSDQMPSMPAHCDPSNCTPEEAAKCPYSHAAQEAAMHTEAACPATKECPPAKCNAGSDKKTL